MVNGTTTPPFSVGRGLRQGCPLSPLLFNLVAESLSALLKKATIQGLFNGVSFGNVGLEVSHLQFADDLILFCGAEERQVRNIVRILKGFEIAAGLKLNLHKSKLYGINFEHSVVVNWAKLLHCQVDTFPSQYLGLPLGASKNSKQLWMPIVERFKKKLVGWKAKLLSIGGRILLVKSVLASLPVYFMSIFSMPASIKDCLSRLIARSIWNTSDKKGIHWISWETLCLPKSCGGLGLTDFQIRNRALLNKWLWRFATEQSCLWRKVMVAKYDESPVKLLPSNTIPKNKSWIWKGIISPLNDPNDLIRSNLKIVIGNGRSVLFWYDIWVGNKSLKEAFPRLFSLAINKSGFITDYGRIVNNRWQWEIVFRRRLFEWEKSLWIELSALINSVGPTALNKDSIRWMGDSSGCYSAKPYVSNSDVWKFLWLNLTPPKVEVFLWKAVHERIPTKVELAKRGIRFSNGLLCPMCSEGEETVTHVLCHCKVSWSLWQLWFNIWGIHTVMLGNFSDFLLSWMSLPAPSINFEIWQLAFLSLLWSIWLARNDRVFNSKCADVNQMFESSLVNLGRWIKAKWHGISFSIEYIMFNPLVLTVKVPRQQPKKELGWIKPESGSLKFNVDGAVERGFGRAGIGGVLRDSSGGILLMFSRFAGVLDATSAEILAVKEALFVYCKSGRGWNQKLIIENDCAALMDWFRHPSSSPPVFRQLIDSCAEVSSTITWEVQHISREANKTADLLAKAGISRTLPLLWVCNVREAACLC